MRFRFLIRLVFLSLILASPLAAQVSTTPLTFTKPLEPIPFDEWLAAGHRSEIPWNLEILPARLSYYLRLYAPIRARVPTNWFRNRPGEHVVVFSIRIADPIGRWLSPETPIEIRTLGELHGGSSIQFSFQPFLLPGEYSIAVVLHDRTTGQRNVTRRSLIVPTTSNSLLLHAWGNLRPVEFPSDDFEGLDRSFLPSTVPLTLPVSNPAPVRLDIVLNFAASEELPRSRRAHRSNVDLLLAALNVFSHLRLERGSVRITALDVSRRQVLFEQDPASPLDWPRLRAAIEQRNPATIDVSALAARHTNAAFFRDVIATRLTSPRVPAETAASTPGPAVSPPPSPAPDSSTPEPRRIIVLLRTPTFLPSDTDFTPITPPPACNCSVYDFRFRTPPDDIWDNLNRVIKPLRPRTFSIDSPDGFRHALSSLLSDLSSSRASH